MTTLHARYGWRAGSAAAVAALLLALLGLLASAGAGALGAQEPLAAARTVPGDSLPADPLRDVAREALAGNRELARAGARVRRAEAEVAEARGRMLPSASLSGRYTEQSGTVNLGEFVNPAYAALNRLTGSDDFPTDLDFTLPLKHESSVRLVQPVFHPALWAGYDAARDGLASRRAGRRAQARATVAQAQAGLLQVAAAGRLRAIWEATLPLVEEAERVSQRLVDAGTATPDAVFRARADRSEVEQRLDEAREAEAAAGRALNQLLARPLDAPHVLPDEAALDGPLPVDEEGAVRSALARREELAALESAGDAARAGVRVATAGFLPTASLALDYGFQGRELAFDSDSDFWTASVVLSWNVFSGGQTSARRRAARAEVEETDLHLAETTEQMRLEARQAWQAARVARDAITTARDRAQAAERSYELVRRRYDEGLATPVELIDARTAHTNAELNRALAVYRYALRRVELERAAALRDLDTLEILP